MFKENVHPSAGNMSSQKYLCLEKSQAKNKVYTTFSPRYYEGAKNPLRFNYLIIRTIMVIES